MLPKYRYFIDKMGSHGHELDYSTLSTQSWSIKANDPLHWVYWKIKSQNGIWQCWILKIAVKLECKNNQFLVF